MKNTWLIPIIEEAERRKHCKLSINFGESDVPVVKNEITIVKPKSRRINTPHIEGGVYFETSAKDENKI